MRHISLDSECNGNSHETCERKTSASSSITSDSSGSTASTASASKFHLLKIPNDRNIDQTKHKCNEPIYAVVNLKNKYENRAKKKNVGEETMNDFILRRGRPNSFHVNSGEYEEVCSIYFKRKKNFHVEV